MSTTTIDSVHHTAAEQKHGGDCGHLAVAQRDHVDYAHDGHRHAAHDGHGHWDDH
jgi:hypothetical protein